MKRKQKGLVCVILSLLLATEMIVCTYASASENASVSGDTNEALH